MNSRAIEILSDELEEACASISAESWVVNDLIHEAKDAMASEVAKALYSRLLKAADAAWKIHESLDKGESA